MSKDKIVAAFDFDGTITTKDALLPFLAYATSKRKLYLNLVRLLPALAGFPLGILSRQEAKEHVLTATIGGMPLSLALSFARHFAEEELPLLVKPTAIERFHWHKAQGHTTVLISANLALFLKPWADRAGFKHLLATDLETSKENTITGKLLGANCYGQEKVRRLEALLGPKSGYELYAYGDSPGDKELLAIADHPEYRFFK